MTLAIILGICGTMFLVLVMALCRMGTIVSRQEEANARRLSHPRRTLPRDVRAQDRRSAQDARRTRVRR